MAKVRTQRSQAITARQSSQTVDPRADQAQKSARDWQALLTWARKLRGPQWDYSIATYLVDQSSPEYYEGVKRDHEAEAKANEAAALAQAADREQQQLYATEARHAHHHQRGDSPYERPSRSVAPRRY